MLLQLGNGRFKGHDSRLELIRLPESELLESTLLHNFEESHWSPIPKSLYFTILISGVGVAVLTLNPLFSGVMLESESLISGIVSTLNKIDITVVGGESRPNSDPKVVKRRRDRANKLHKFPRRREEEEMGLWDGRCCGARER